MTTPPKPAAPSNVRPQRPWRGGSVMLKALIAAGVVGVAGATIYAVSGSSAGDGSQRLATADVARVSTTSFEITTTVTGDLQARKQTEIRSRLESESSIVQLVPEGTMVKEGDVLVVLNSDSIRTRLQEEESRVEAAKAELAAAESAYSIQVSENESKFRQAELKLKLAKLAREQWDNGERVQKLKDIELDLDNTEKELSRLTDKVTQSIALEKEGFLSKDELDRDEIALRKAKADRERAVLEDRTYRSYQEPMDRATKVSDVAEAEAELLRVQEQNKSQLSSKEADLFNRQRQLQIRTENASKLQKQLEACTMIAPQDGLVVYGTSANEDQGRWNNSGPLMVGRRVVPNETLIILPDTSEMIAQVRVHESLAGRVRKGQLATVRVDAASGRTFTGTVDSIGVLAEGGGWRDPNRREYSVKIALQTSRDTSLKPSMRCEATIVLGRVDGALALPVQAVFADDAVRFVYVPRAGKFARVPVKIGQRSDTLAQIAAGLSEGDRVLTRTPAPAEVIREDWNPAQLQTVGLKVGADGKVEPLEGRAPALADRPGPPEIPAGPGGERGPGRRGGGEGGERRAGGTGGEGRRNAAPAAEPERVAPPKPVAEGEAPKPAAAAPAETAPAGR